MRLWACQSLIPCSLLQVASARDVLSMSNEGTGGAFVNSHGYVHDMITLHRATNTSCEGEPETEHSWFPGYAWTIAYCAGCANHLVSKSLCRSYAMADCCVQVAM
jgi:cereblon